jgi:diguanylate cyclase (GGDEF)-like protein
MSTPEEVVETRGITAKEAEQCATEQIQFIGSIQPHGFTLLVDQKSNEIIQYSANLLPLLNQELEQPLNTNTQVLNTNLSDWMEVNVLHLSTFLVSSKTRKVDFGAQGRISSQKWECLVADSGDYWNFEFFQRGRQEDAAHLLGSLDQILTRFRETTDSDSLFQGITDEFQKLTGYDRVMLYKFHEDWTGEVLSESVSGRAEQQYLGLRFPAEDIPKNAREQYKNSSLRILADVDAEPVPLVPQTLPSGKSFHQGSSVLRSMSPMHLMYLKNMGVRASMSIALMSKGKLWGLVAFHHYSPRMPGLFTLSELKASCELFTEIVLAHLNPMLDMEQIQKAVQAKSDIDGIFTRLKLAGKELSWLPEVLTEVRDITQETYLGYCLDGHCHMVSESGPVELQPTISDSLETLFEQAEDRVFESSQLLVPPRPTVLSKDADIAGIMMARGRSVPGLIVFFGAPEVRKEINWGGVPNSVNIVARDGVRRLEPRNSFALWRQEVIGQCDEWTSAHRDILETYLAATEDFVLYRRNEEAHERLKVTSYTDTLTGLPNRRYLSEYFEKLAAQELDICVSLFFLDLDNFKKINDYIGHHAGDRLLIETAKRLKYSVRLDDLVCRLGGDEFVVVIQHKSSKADTNQAMAERIADNIIEAVGQPVFEGDQPMISTASVGAITCNARELSFGDILQRADIAMYNAKHFGKNRVHFFSNEDLKQARREGLIETELRKCLQQKCFQVYYQPQVDNQGIIVGAEALARWTHPEMGVIGPDVFIPLAEKNHLIKELGLQMLEKVCAQLAQWRADEDCDDLRTISVNFSAMHLLSEGFVNDVSEIVAKYGLSNHEIRLEITESLFIEDFSVATAILASLRELGFTISMDDFGTGYSSLNYLWKLPIDEVKIDRSFVVSMSEDDNSLTMVEGIVSLCNKLNLDVVAEGVEKKIELRLLRLFGCKIFQGYYLGRPVPADEFQFTIEQQ